MLLNPSQMLIAAQAVATANIGRDSLLGLFGNDLRNSLAQPRPTASTLEKLLVDVQTLCRATVRVEGRPAILVWLEGAVMLSQTAYPDQSSALQRLIEIVAATTPPVTDALSPVAGGGPTNGRLGGDGASRRDSARNTPADEPELEVHQAGLIPDGARMQVILNRDVLRSRLPVVEESGHVLILRGPKKSGRSTAGAFVAWFAAERGHTVVPIIDTTQFEPVDLVQSYLMPLLAIPSTAHDPSTFIDPPKLEPLAETVANWIRERIEDAFVREEPPKQTWLVFDRLDAASQMMRDFAYAVAMKLCHQRVAEYARTVLCDVDMSHAGVSARGIVITEDMQFDILREDLGRFVDWLYLKRKGRPPPSPTRRVLVDRMMVDNGVPPVERLAVLARRALEVAAQVPESP